MLKSALESFLTLEQDQQKGDYRSKYFIWTYRFNELTWPF